MTFWEGDKHKKPDRWGFDPGLIAPEWYWFWKDLQVCYPLWEGIGDARDLTGNGHVGVLSVQAPWVSGVSGHAYNNEPSLGNLQLTPPWDFVDDRAISCFLFMDLKVIEAASHGFWRTRSSSGGNTFFITNEGAGMWIRGGGTDLIKNSFTLEAGLVSYGMAMASGDTRVYMNGINRGSSSTTFTWPSGIESELHNLGFQFDNIEPTRFEMAADYFAAYFWNRLLSDAEFGLLHHDPFGPFRMVDDIDKNVLSSEVVAADNSIWPILWRRRRR